MVGGAGLTGWSVGGSSGIDVWMIRPGKPGVHVTGIGRWWRRVSGIKAVGAIASAVERRGKGNGSTVTTDLGRARGYCNNTRLAV